jgi:hypothetical protein
MRTVPPAGIVPAGGIMTEEDWVIFRPRWSRASTDGEDGNCERRATQLVTRLGAGFDVHDVSRKTEDRLAGAPLGRVS